MSDWQEKIIAAKREGEQLKEKIRQKKEDLNDADRSSPSAPSSPPPTLLIHQSVQWQGISLHYRESP
jgi:hypothetical protein